MLIGPRRLDPGLGPLTNGWEASALLVIRIVLALLIDGQITVEGHDLAGGTQAGLAICRDHLDRGALDAGRLHLTGRHTPPDKVIESTQIVIEAKTFRVPRQAGRPDRLVRFLGVFLLGFVAARLRRQIGCAIPVLDDCARLSQGLGRHIDTVGPHIGDQTALGVDAFVQLLRGLHGALGREAELAGGLLLQRRGRERRWWRTARRRFLNRANGEGSGFDSRLGRQGRRFIVQVELGQLLAGMGDQSRQEGRPFGGHIGFDGPVFLGPKLLDFDLAVDDQPERDGLHPSCRAGTGQLAPQHRRQVEADQIIQRPARQIGIDQFHVDLTRIGHGLGHGRAGDGVEGDALDGLVLERLLPVQGFQDMPADGLTFAIRVGRQDQTIRRFHCRSDIGQAFGRLGIDLPFHREVVVGPDRSILGRQVADMPVGRQDRIVRAQVLVDGLGLGRALDDDDVHAEVLRPFKRSGKVGVPPGLVNKAVALRPVAHDSTLATRVIRVYLENQPKRECPYADAH